MLFFPFLVRISEDDKKQKNIRNLFWNEKIYFLFSAEKIEL